MWGGFIISLSLPIIKNLIGKTWTGFHSAGFLYGMNYSARFVIVRRQNQHWLPSSLLFTASAVGSSLDTKIEGSLILKGWPPPLQKSIKEANWLLSLCNLVIVFPLTFLLAWGYHAELSDKRLLRQRCQKMLADQHPWRSGALCMPALQVFYFSSGIICRFTGKTKFNYGRIGKGWKNIRAWNVSLSNKTAGSFCPAYIEKHLGAIIGNMPLVSFSVSPVCWEKYSGIPFDIKHITIAASNSAITVYGLE